MATKKALPKKAAKKPAKPAKKAPAPKKAVKPAAKKASKPAPKKAAKKPAPAKKVAAKPVKKAAPKKPAPKKSVKPAPKPVAKAAAKKVAVGINKKAAEPAKKAAAKPAPVKAAPAKQEPPKKTVIETVKQVAKAIIQPIVKPPVKKEPAKPIKVVVPKTSTDKKVKYEPDFTKSVLDANNREKQQTGPTMSYSDAELVEFRELISKKLDTAKKELAYLQGLITRKDESGDLDEGRYMTMEDGSMSMEREQLSQMASRQIQFIDHLEKAIMRIENKTYGICRVTGKLIDKARLRAVPHATLSIEAKQMMNK
jgi:RNA polymerase-binding transcription factor DksA